MSAREPIGLHMAGAGLRRIQGGTEMYQMTETEYKFAELIWEEEPIGSGELVKQCAEKFGWKKSTTYTEIKRLTQNGVLKNENLCENGIFKNENAIVSSVLNKEEYHRAQGEAFVEKAYGGSLPKMIAAFIQSKKLSAAQIAEIEAMIEDYKG